VGSNPNLKSSGHIHLSRCASTTALESYGKRKRSRVCFLIVKGYELVGLIEEDNGGRRVAHLYWELTPPELKKSSREREISFVRCVVASSRSNLLLRT
jgi:hypothetical protein